MLYCHPDRATTKSASYRKFTKEQPNKMLMRSKMKYNIGLSHTTMSHCYFSTRNPHVRKKI